MVEHIEDKKDLETKKADQELSDAELAKVAGGIVYHFEDIIVSSTRIRHHRR